MSTKTILVIEDDRKISEAARFALESHGFQVVQAFTGISGLEIAEHHSPDAVVIDMHLTDINGLEICRRLRAVPMTAALPILLLTAAGNDSERIAALETGADDSLTKTFSARELAVRIRALIRRATLHERLSMVLERGALKVDTTTHQVSYAGQAITLTATEFRILVHLATHPDTVFSREDILRNIRDEDTAVLDRCIDVHVLGLRRKLLGGKEIKTVRGFGYKFSLAA